MYFSVGPNLPERTRGGSHGAACRIILRVALEFAEPRRPGSND
jgi:hypothetical protein